MNSDFVNFSTGYSIVRGITMDDLRGLFPDAVADAMNLCMFSTSGTHGSYATIEQIEKSLQKYGESQDFSDDDDVPDDWVPPALTVLIIHPRTVCLRCGEVAVTLGDIGFLKKLQTSSWEQFSQIGRG